MKQMTKITLSSVLVFLSSLLLNTASAEITDSDIGGLKLVSDDNKVQIYTRTGTDLSKYTSFYLKSVTVAFDQDWLKDYNRERKSLSERLDEKDLTSIASQFDKAFQKTLSNTLENAGKAKLVGSAMDNALTVEAAIVNLHVNAPDKPSASRKTSLVRQAGEAELHTKMYDASGTLVVAIVDSKETREHFDLFETNRVRNQYEFSAVYRQWAENWLKSVGQ